MERAEAPDNSWGELMAARREASPAVLRFVALVPNDLKVMLTPFELVRGVDLYTFTKAPEMKAALYGLFAPSDGRDYMLKDGADGVTQALGVHGQRLVDVVPDLFREAGLVHDLQTPAAGKLWDHLLFIGYNLLDEHGDNVASQWAAFDEKLSEMAST